MGEGGRRTLLSLGVGRGEVMFAGLADARRLFDQGTIEERKRVVRAFVESLTVVGSKRSGQIRMRKVPSLEALGDAFSVESLAGVRCEVEPANGAGPRPISLTFACRGNALVPIAFAPKRGSAPALGVTVGA